ncbi:hypothetical protein O181_005885 [Austropuccinia psidii MF-1]|uniref:Uncharacterized protein n=1 Tax=Austropuccinia psidii MF-1 TaxID=1389203 RepID=A0A9Q3BJU9_9BASI|nr:hypothetical protein [Austropuccinia psidii MF-1]
MVWPLQRFMTLTKPIMVSNLSDLLSHPASIVRRRGFLVLNLLLLGPPGANFETLKNKTALRPTIGSQTIPEDYEEPSRRVEDFDWKLLLMNPPPLMPPLSTPIVITGYRIRGFQQWNNTNRSWTNIGRPIHPQGNPIGVAPGVPILLTIKDGRLEKLKRNLVVQDAVYTNSEGSDELDGEELEMTTPIQKRRIQSTSLSPVQASTTIHEVIRSPPRGHPHFPPHPPMFSHPWPELPETQYPQNLSQSLTTINTGI